jgi:inosose dehydratase
MLKIANAPVSWGVLEFELEGETQLYGQVLDEIQETGYTGTELGDWGFLPTEPEELKRELQSRGLELVGAFVPVALADRDTHKVGETTALRTAHLLAEVGGENALIILADKNGSVAERTNNAGRIKPEHGLNETQWKIFADGVSRIAKAVRDETRLRLVFHHHCAGYVETPAEVQKLLSLTDPTLVGLCLDTGHYRFGGGDPVRAVESYADRIWHVHFKDSQPEIAERSRREGWDYFQSVREGIFSELGKGEVNFPAVIQALRDMGFERWIVVEQDVLPGMGTPKESALRNRNYLRSISLH